MGGDIETFSKAVDTIAKLRASLLLNLPRLLATYFESNGKQPQISSNWSDEGKSTFKDESSFCTTQATSGALTHADLHDEAKSALKDEAGPSIVEQSKGTSEDNSGMKDGASMHIHEIISTDTDRDFPDEWKAKTSMHEDLEGFFFWLDVEADGGEYAGVIERDPGSQLGFLKEFLRKPIGSGINGKPLVRMTCRNKASDRACPFAPSDTTTCTCCRLVKYCSTACAAAHKDTHVEDFCKYLKIRAVDFTCPMKDMIRHLGKNLPQRSHEDHANAEFNNPVLPVYGLLRDLVLPPALLVHKDGHQTSMATSPRSSYDGSAEKDTSSPQNHLQKRVLPNHVRLLFSALFDLRNVFETVRNIPDDYTGSITFFLNFAEAKLAVRDFLILELLRYHGAAAIDLAIGLWYSVAITATQDTHLMLTIVRMLRKWQSSLPSMGNQHLSETYQQSFPRSTMGSSLRADFGISIWNILKELVCSDECNRRGFDDNVQYTWRWNTDTQFMVDACRPSHLASWCAFEMEGFLLPFGAAKAPFTIPNRVRYSASSDRISRYKNDPLSGWDLEGLYPAVQSKGVCDGDLYGCLFFQLREMMEVFVQKTASCCIRLRLTQFRTSKLFRILKESGLKFQRIDACALDYDKEVFPEEAMEECGVLLAENATPEWPSLVLTMTCEEGNIGAGEAYKKGMEIKRELVPDARGLLMASPYKRGFWKAIDPVTVRTYVELIGSKGLTSSSSDEEAGRGKSQEHAAAKMGLHKQKRHRIVSPIPAISLEDSWQPLSRDAVYKYVGGNYMPYYNLVFSGFTLQERFHEWGWAPGHQP